MSIGNFQTDGFALKKNVIPISSLNVIQQELLSVAALLNGSNIFSDLDDSWNYHKKVNRRVAGKIYNAFKHLQSIKKLASSEPVEHFLRDVCNITAPALIDVNCRIDSYGEEKYLFGWHQDYWFSVSSTKAVVLWIPLSMLSPDVGGLELISNKFTGGRIFKTKQNTGKYNSYADAVILDDDIGHYPRTEISDMDLGDIACFAFNVLHKSLPISSTTKSRFTVQLRFADFQDTEFIGNDYKPGVVNENTVSYLQRT
jgi:hypothetical protein